MNEIKLSEDELKLLQLKMIDLLKEYGFSLEFAEDVFRTVFHYYLSKN